jgi:hypothetical protein
MHKMLVSASFSANFVLKHLIVFPPKQNQALAIVACNQSRFPVLLGATGDHFRAEGDPDRSMQCPDYYYRRNMLQMKWLGKHYAHFRIDPPVTPQVYYA